MNCVQQKSPFSPSARFYPASDTCAIGMVANGMGVTIISSLQVRQLPPGLVAREFEGDYGRNLGIAVKSLKHSSPAIREFIRISRETAAQFVTEHAAD